MALNKATGAGALQPSAINDLIVEPVVKDSVAAQVSTVIIGAQGSKLRIPKIADENTVSNLFTAELAEIELLNPTVSQVELEWRKIAALSVLSSEVIQDSEMSVLDVAGRSLTRELVRKIDTAAFGDAAPANGFAGLQSYHALFNDGFSTDASNADFAIEAAAAIRNVDGTPQVILTTPNVLVALQKAKVATGSEQPLFGTSAAAAVGQTVNGLPVLTSPHVKADTLYVIDPSALTFAIRRDVTLDTDSSAAFSVDGTMIRIVTRMAFGVVEPSKISVIDYTP
ncbi:MAG: phage major capsid protein [Gordonia amarae]